MVTKTVTRACGVVVNLALLGGGTAIAQDEPSACTFEVEPEKTRLEEILVDSHPLVAQWREETGLDVVDTDSLRHLVSDVDTLNDSTCAELRRAVASQLVNDHVGSGYRLNFFRVENRYIVTEFRVDAGFGYSTVIVLERQGSDLELVGPSLSD